MQKQLIPPWLRSTEQRILRQPTTAESLHVLVATLRAGRRRRCFAI
uniref:Uncharacterized protein n=1 Tax=Anguilla anguilla TaxID=7936 RepID=A0A0E9XK40_ANGAN